VKLSQINYNDNKSIYKDVLSSINYTYDVRNRLTEVDKDGVKTGFKYNTEGLRYASTTGANTVQYQYDNSGRVITEGDAAGNITANYVWAADRLLVKKDVASGNEYYYLYNGHGDVTQIVDIAGNVVNSYEYDAWGNVTSQVEGINNSFKYAGEILDSETGLYYLRARYYDAVSGRFLGEDSFEGKIANPLSLNGYTYCINNPILYTDPSGHEQKTENWETKDWRVADPDKRIS
jgi:RHS repeat-associated protein